MSSSSSSVSPPPLQVQVGGEEGKGKGASSSGGGSTTRENQEEEVVVVGYALSPKKVESFITPSLLNLAQHRGIRLLPIHPSTPLLNQGPFHCILHKLPLSEGDWEPQLIRYSSLNPRVPIIDPPHAIRRLHDRLSMLRVVSDLQIPPSSSSSSSCSFGVPNQICVSSTAATTTTPEGDDDLNVVVDFPVIAKPLVSDGTAKSHQMYLVFNREGLHKLGMEMEPPYVLQQFVNHGGVVFKVYVVGDHVSCVRRNSLPDYDHVEGGDNNNNNNLSLLPFSQISNITTGTKSKTKSKSKTMTKQGEGEEEEEEEEYPMPPLNFLTDLAKGLRDALELNLFNFDVIRDGSSSSHYYIIDINYFPGYAKMPNYETVFTDFLLHHIRQYQLPSS